MKRVVKQLLLGAGTKRDRRIALEGEELVWDGQLTTHDLWDADWCWDLNWKPWPWDDSQFDQVHAYEVLEHLGSQGDVEAFFADFGEIWRILKPGGRLYATVPDANSRWMWGDPGHRRAILVPETLVFLERERYEEDTPMSDYRDIWGGDFRILQYGAQGESSWFVLEAIK